MYEIQHRKHTRIIWFHFVTSLTVMNWFTYCLFSPINFLSWLSIYVDNFWFISKSTSPRRTWNISGIQNWRSTVSRLSADREFWRRCQGWGWWRTRLSTTSWGETCEVWGFLFLIKIFRVRVTISCKMNFDDYPLDDHVCQFQVGSCKLFHYFNLKLFIRIL